MFIEPEGQNDELIPKHGLYISLCLFALLSQSPCPKLSKTTTSGLHIQKYDLVRVELGLAI